MASSKRNIANIGSPPDDPTCPLPGILYVPDPDVFPQPWDCVVGTVAGHFTVSQDLHPLDRPMRDLAAQGFLCLAFYVRLLDPIPGQTTTGKWHQQTDDYKIAIQYMRGDPGGFGYGVSGFVAAIGGSGSGHHALYSALDGEDGVDRSDAALCMSPPTDFSDREPDVQPEFIIKCEQYADVTDLPTLLARSPISLDLPTANPILHYNGDSESMPLSQLTRFRDAIAVIDVPSYQWRINTGTLGQQHSFAMWRTIAEEAIAWLFSVAGGVQPDPGPPPPPPPPVPGQQVIVPVQREGIFRPIWNRVIQRLGRDPWKNIPYDLRRAVVEHINQRVDTICKVWRWPFWEVTEERAFRPIWNAGTQWLINDEVFYIPTMSYYRGGGSGPNPSDSDPPVGTLPTNTSYWSEIENIDTFIAYDQTCKRAIGQVLSVFKQNPRAPTSSMNGALSFMPSEKGVDVSAGGPTVFLTYKLPVPKYTMEPILQGFPYLKGDIRFDPFAGDCFQAVADNNGVSSSNPNAWRLIPFPEQWRNYVVEGAYADALSELDPTNENVAVNLALAKTANEKADMLLQVEVDVLTVQGQRLPSNSCQQWGCWCESLPWNGGEVTTLTDECFDDITTPMRTTAATIRWGYYQDIIALNTDDGTPSLAQVVTITQGIGSRADLVINGQALQFQLVDGPTDPSDAGHVAPDDYDVDTNDKHWEKVL